MQSHSVISSRPGSIHRFPGKKLTPLIPCSVTGIWKNTCEVDSAENLRSGFPISCIISDMFEIYQPWSMVTLFIRKNNSIINENNMHFASDT